MQSTDIMNFQSKVEKRNEQRIKLAGFAQRLSKEKANELLKERLRNKKKE